jgi:tetratricopeptide (TPR) repeat protein
VLITCRNAAWSPYSLVRPLPLTPLERLDSLRLLLTPRAQALNLGWEQLRASPACAAADAICAELGDLPLALTLAGAYLGAYPRLDLGAYLRQLRGRPAADESLNQELRAGLPRDHAPSIVATFGLSYDQLRATDPADALALAMLHAAGHCAPEPIPCPLLMQAAGCEPDSAEGQRRGDGAIERLRALGLIEVDGESSVKLHRLLAAYVRWRDPAPGQSRDGLARAAVALVRRLDERDEDERQGAYRPHLEALLEPPPGDPALHADLLYWLANAFYDQDDVATVGSLLEQALALREEALGPEHTLVADTLIGLALTVYAADNFPAARDYLTRALIIKERAIGPDHVEMTEFLAALGVVEHELGNLPAARDYLTRAVAITERARGPDHLQTAYTLHELGITEREAGNLPAARAAFERALAIKEHARGPDDIQVAYTLHELGVTEREAGNLPAARDILARAAAFKEQALGPNATSLAYTLHELGITLGEAGNLPAARTAFERALAITERARGPDDIQVAVTLHSLGVLRDEEGSFARARQDLRRALAITRAQLGAKHKQSRITRNTLWGTYAAEALWCGLAAGAGVFLARALLAPPLELPLAILLGLLGVAGWWLRPALIAGFGVIGAFFALSVADLLGLGVAPLLLALAAGAAAALLFWFYGRFWWRRWQARRRYQRQTRKQKPTP